MNERAGPTRLRDVLDEVAAPMGLARAADAEVVWSRWSEIVGDQIARHAEPTSLRGGVLRVRTSSPAWASELNYLRADIALRANELVGRAAVSEVRIWTAPGAVERSAAPPPAERAARPTEVPKDPLEGLRRAHKAWLERRNPGAV